MNRIPRRLQADAPSEELSAQDGHLLQAVDGNLDEQELAFVVGLDTDEVGTLLDRLAELGLVSFDPEEVAVAAGGAEAEADVDEADIGDGIALSEDARHGILLMHGQLGSLNHYELLGLERSATVKEIKKAYYRLAPTFHPDKHFGKELGEYKTKIEAIFTAITRAHDTLRYKKRRGAYDATLPPEHKSAAPAVTEPAGNPESAGQAEQKSATAQNEASVTAAPSPEPPVAASRSSSATAEARSETAKEGIFRSVSVPAVDSHRPSRRGTSTGKRNPPRRQRASTANEARREALRRKLRGHASRTSRPSIPEAASAPGGAGYSAPEGVPKSAAESLREKFEQAGKAKRVKQRRTLESAGDSAMAQGRYVVAAECYARAQKHAPDDANIAEKLENALSLSGSE